MGQRAHLFAAIDHQCARAIVRMAKLYKDEEGAFAAGTEISVGGLVGPHAVLAVGQRTDGLHLSGVDDLTA